MEAAGSPTQWTKAEAVLLESGFMFALGHGVGLEVHEEPILGMLGTRPLAPVTSSPSSPALSPGACGVRVEDLVLVTEDGDEKLDELPVRARALAR